MNQAPLKIAVVIPAYRVKKQVLDVLRGIGPEVAQIILVDDACPEHSADFVEANFQDPRLTIVRHERNQGVGGAMVSGYRKALELNADVVVKLDGDGQMNPAQIPELVHAIEIGEADYCKGNRFFSIESLAEMPIFRLVANSVVSFVSKAVSSYWNLMDPANGFTAIHANVLRAIPLDKIDRGYFFESDMLFRLGLLRAVAQDIPIDARYADEISNIKIPREAVQFPIKYFTRFWKRICYSYFIHDFNVCSVEMITGSLLLLFGIVFGGIHWRQSILLGVPATSGTVILAALPVVVGTQLLIAALSFDVNNVPKKPIHVGLGLRRQKRSSHDTGRDQ
ncbi:MAG: glycosyltransferase family 2 protein [Bdellovibrionota bacterium]